MTRIDILPPFSALSNHEDWTKAGSTNDRLCLCDIRQDYAKLGYHVAFRYQDKTFIEINYFTRKMIAGESVKV